MILALLSLLSTEAAACGMPADYDFALTELMAEIDQAEIVEIEAVDSAGNPLEPLPDEQRAPSEPPQQQEQQPLS